MPLLLASRVCTMAAVINLQTPVGESSTATAMAANSKEIRGSQRLRAKGCDATDFVHVLRHGADERGRQQKRSGF